MAIFRLMSKRGNSAVPTAYEGAERRSARTGAVVREGTVQDDARVLQVAVVHSARVLPRRVVGEGACVDSSVVCPARQELLGRSSSFTSRRLTKQP